MDRAYRTFTSSLSCAVPNARVFVLNVRLKFLIIFFVDFCPNVQEVVFQKESNNDGKATE